MTSYCKYLRKKKIKIRTNESAYNESIHFPESSPLVDLSKVARDQGAIVVAAFPAVSTIKAKSKKKFGLGAFERGYTNTGATFSRRGRSGASTGNPYAS